MIIAKQSLAGAAPLALLVLLGTAGAASAQRNVEEGRPRDAVAMCVERAEEIIRERDRGRNVEVDEIDEAEEDEDRVRVRGQVRVEDDDGDSRGTARLDCEVDFGGENRIAEFDEERLLSSLEDDDRGGDRRGDGEQVADRAREACRRVARENDWTDIRAEVRDRRDDDGRLVLDMRGQRDNFSPERRCRFDPDSGEARFDDPT